jgi:8-hydroxy-5-deazaflavin:NADPH oxidoreductase
MSAPVMVDPASVAGGEHDVFVSGNDAGAKAKVIDLLKSFGWKSPIDLGDTPPREGPSRGCRSGCGSGARSAHRCST